MPWNASSFKRVKMVPHAYCRSYEFLKFYHIDLLIYVHKNLFMHISAHKICNECGANIERSFAYKIKSYSIETLY